MSLMTMTYAAMKNLGNSAVWKASCLLGLMALAGWLPADGRCRETGLAVIRNGVPWTDAAGHEIWCNGGHMIRVEDRFYWVGYDTGPGRWPWRINLYSSADLALWNFENTIIRHQGPFRELGWAGRPAMLYCPRTGRYVILFEADSPSQWERHKVGFAVCDRIDGDYRLLQMQYPEGRRTTGDQSVFQEGNTAYLVATMDRDIDGKKFLNQSLAIFKLTPDFLRVERKIFEGFDRVDGGSEAEPRHHTSREASHIIKVDGRYYWFSSALVGWNSSATRYATADRLEGPWSALKPLRTNPPSEDSFNTQHDFIIPVTGSNTTTWVYVGDRYSQWTHHGNGRNIFLPIVWDHDEPVLTWQTQWTINPATGIWSVEGQTRN